MWIQTHRWLSELSLTLILPVGLYLCIAVGLRNIVQVSPGDVPFQAWILPGIVFIVALLSSYFPIFIDLFENRRLLPFFESIAGSPNSGLSIVTALAISLLPDVILRCLVAGIILQLLAGFALQVLPFLGLMFFVAILSVLVINLSLTITLMTRNSLTHLFGAFILLLFLILILTMIRKMKMVMKSRTCQLQPGINLAWLPSQLRMIDCLYLLSNGVFSFLLQQLFL